MQRLRLCVARTAKLQSSDILQHIKHCPPDLNPKLANPQPEKTTRRQLLDRSVRTLGFRVLLHDLLGGFRALGCRV